MRTLIVFLAALFSTSLFSSCAPSRAYTPQPYVQLTHPEWAQDAVIYQINTRQFTPEGTFRAAQRQLPRLENLGVDILWLMPIHPIGKVNRKGSLGSPYAIQDYKSVNPELGTLEDFKAFVRDAQARDMKVIIDWVANHSAWDNPLVDSNPNWYAKDWKGSFHPTPWTDWSDIIDFNFSNPELRKYMTEAMVYWVRDVGIDGYRADVAGFVPLDFWVEVRRQLDSIKPVFMLAEWQQRDLHQNAFDASYGWAWKEAAQDVAAGKADAGRLRGFYADDLLTWPEDAYRMLYTSNHDQNAWDGTPMEIYGDAYETMLALQFVSRGIPLIYNGQEAYNEKQLAFFERDPIVWRTHEIGEFIKRLIQIKKENPALWNGDAGGMTIPVSTDRPDALLSFAREKEGNRVLAMFNVSGSAVSFELKDGPVAGRYRNAMDKNSLLELSLGTELSLTAWDYLILIENK